MSVVALTYCWLAPDSDFTVGSRPIIFLEPATFV